MKYITDIFYCKNLVIVNSNLIRSFFKKNYLSFVFGIATFAGLYFIDKYNYLLFHSLVELFSIVVAFGIFIVAWNSKKFLDNNYLLFVGIAYLFMALIDLLHTFAYSGMSVFIGFAGSNLATQLWISARYIQAISMLLALFFITRKLNYILQSICYLIITTFILLIIFYWKLFPVSYIEGSGLTTFKITSEYVITFMLLAAIVLLYLYRKEFNKTVFTLIIVSIVLTILSELSFTLYSDIYGLFNQLGHFFKLLSFLMVYKAIIETGFSQPFGLLFFKLKQSEKELKLNEEKYHSLYSSMSEGSTLVEIIYDESKKPLDYRILDANDAVLSMLGTSKERVIGKKASEVYDMDITPYLDAFSQVAHTGKPVRFENYYPKLKKYFLISVFSPSKGKFATIFADITEQKKIEIEIESISRFPLENPNPIMRMNNENLITFANEPAKYLLQQLDSEKTSKLLKFLYGSITGSIGKKNDNSKIVETKINKSIYEFTIIHVKNFEYFNIYGKDITIRKKSERQAKKRGEEKIINDQRNKLARELHDTVTQVLFSANLTADIIPKLWKKDPEAVIKKLGELRKLNNVALMEMRVLLYELRPSTLKDENLGNLLQGLVKTIGTRSKIPIELTISGESKLSPKIELSYYRIAQEALNNMIEHSNATKAVLVFKSFPGKLFMEITDNGQGFDDKKIASTSLGLTIMRERAKLIGASISIDKLPGKGTRITVIYIKKDSKKLIVNN